MEKKFEKLRKLLSRMFGKGPQRKFFYGFFCKYFKVKKRVILIESFHGQTVGDSSLVLAQEILRSYKGKYKIYYASENIPLHQKFINEIGLDVELIDVSTFKYTKILATAGYIISNASLPIYFVKRKGQKYLQTWHGTPLKTLGKKMRMGIESMYNVQHNFLQADYLTEPNDFTKDIIMGDYNLEKLYTGKVVMAGYPRNEIFQKPEESQRIREKLGLTDKTVYGYMPTWRGTSNHSVDAGQYAGEVQTMLRKLDDQLNDNQIFFINFHPILHGAIKLDNYKHIKSFPKGIDSTEFVSCVDCLVTDYSSVFFDFSLTKKPIVLFMYDYDEYLSDRGINMDIKSLPFRQIYNLDDFCDAMVSEAWRGDSYEDTEYYKTFFKYDAPDISKRLLDMLFDGKEDGFKIIDYAKNKEKKLNVIYPANFTGEADFKTLSKICTDNDVVLFEKKWFKGDVSPILYDKYNDDFNYIITTNTPPRTHMEDILSKFLKKYRNRIHQTDIQRCFPNLNINPKHTKSISCFEEGCKIGPSTTVMLNSGFVVNDEKMIRIKADFSKYELKSQVLLTHQNEVLAIYDLDREGDLITYDIKAMLDSGVIGKGKYILGVFAKDKKGKDVLLTFTNELKYKSGIKKCNRFDFSPLCYDQIDYLTGENEDTALSVLPYLNKMQRTYSLFVCAPRDVVGFTNTSCRVTSIRCRRNKCNLTMILYNAHKNDVIGADLIYRSVVDDIKVPMKMRVVETKKGCKLHLSIDFDENMPLKEVYWDFRVRIKQSGTTHSVCAKCSNPSVRAKLFLTNIQCDVDHVHTIFPYLGVKRVLCFCYREHSEYDTAAVRFKEIAAFITYILLKPYFDRKNIWIVYEKFCKTAQDNSLYFFKYCMDKLDDRKKKNIFYVIDKREPDYQNIQQYDKHVIQFMSFKHMLYCLAMKICISSDSTSHLYVWRPKPSIIRVVIKNKQELFLQHGVTAMKKVDQLFGKEGSSPMTYFVTCSNIEHDIVVNEFGYDKNEAPITGFARWDVLEDKSTDDDKFIILMPTWRSWLEEVSNEIFVDSDYFKNYSELLVNPKLGKILEENDLNLIFYLHPKFAGYIDTFKNQMSDRIKCVKFGDEPLNELMMRCKMLITDYSSVCWDILYQSKPVIFYQFDYEKYNYVHGSYIDMTKDLPSDRVTETDDLMSCLEWYAKNSFEQKPEFAEISKKYFKYIDNDNSKRIYDFLKVNGY